MCYVIGFYNLVNIFTHILFYIMSMRMNSLGSYQYEYVEFE